MRVCFFNRSYWPDTGATGQLLTELAEDLAAHHGMDVTVVTGRPVGVQAGDLPALEVRHGVTIVRAAGTTRPPARFFWRATNYVTYFLSAMWAGRRLPAQDVVVALTDPPIIGLAALASKRRGGFVFYCQDIFPEVAALLDDFRSNAVNGLLDRLNRLLVARADRIVALGDTMKARLVDGKGADPAKVDVIHNWADPDAVTPGLKRNPFSEAQGLADRLVVLHAGNIGQSQNLDVVIDAAARLARREDIVWLFIGDGTRRARLEEQVAQRGLVNVRFLPYQPRADLRWTYATADVCLVSLKPGLAGYIVPSKLYTILASGRPSVAAVEASSETAAIIRADDCGVLVAPGDAAALAAAVEALVDDAATRAAMGTRARGAALRYSRTRQVAAHAAVIQAVATR
jgi:colanic acid biosynthesis glycosyl transferase WcaI